LNYKIGLKQAVEEFVKKEYKTDDFQLMVEEINSINDKPNDAKQAINLQDDFDDALYQINV
jgi:hypothetical protein